jgi:hypothetical protein
MINKNIFYRRKMKMAKKKEEVKEVTKVDAKGISGLLTDSNSLFKPIMTILEFAVPNITNGEITVQDVYVDTEKKEHGFELNVSGTIVSVKTSKNDGMSNVEICVEFADGSKKKFEYHEF